MPQPGGFYSRYAGLVWYLKMDLRNPSYQQAKGEILEAYPLTQRKHLKNLAFFHGKNSQQPD